MANDAVARLLEAQRTALAKQLERPYLAYIGVAGLPELEHRAKYLHGKIESLPGADIGRALVYVDHDGQPELWVRPVRHDARGRRHYATDWKRFAKARFGVNWNEADTGTLNIDHLFPTATAVDQGFAYVRVMPLDSESNQRVGPEIEAKMAKEQRYGRNVEKASYLTFVKIFGFRGSLVAQRRPNLGAAAQFVDVLASGGAVQDSRAHRELAFASIAYLLFEICGSGGPKFDELRAAYGDHAL